MPYEEGKLKLEPMPAWKIDQEENQVKETKVQLEAQVEELERKREKYFKSSSGCDYYIDVKRFERHLRMLDKRIKACRDDDKLVKLMNCHAFVSGKKKEFADQILEIARILKESK